MASYSFKKEDLDKSKDDTGLKFPKEISRRANQYESYELGKGINHRERRGEKGCRYNQRTSKNGTSYRQYF